MTSANTMIIAGSNRAPSHTRALADHLADELAARDRRAHVVDLAEHPLPFHDPADHRRPEDAADPRVRAFARAALEAEALVWATPIYHGSVSGSLKNALDNLSMRLLEGKPLLLTANGGGRFGGAVFDHMRSMAVNLHLRPVTCQILSLPDDFDELADGRFAVVDGTLRKRIDRGVDELVDEILRR